MFEDDPDQIFLNTLNEFLANATSLLETWQEAESAIQEGLFCKDYPFEQDFAEVICRIIKWRNACATYIAAEQAKVLVTYQEEFEFANTKERDKFLDNIFPKRECTDVPGLYNLPVSGEQVGVHHLKVTYYKRSQ